jgi:hypothetical protein
MIAGEQTKKAWNRVVRDTQDRMARARGRSVSFTEAMVETRKNNPGLFDAYQSVALPSPVLSGRTV